MNTRLAGLVSPIVCLGFMTAAASRADPDAKPVKTTVKADDGLNLVCEVRGHGDTALVLLHGWCGDREYWKHQADVFAADYVEGAARRRPGEYRTDVHRQIAHR